MNEHESEPVARKDENAEATATLKVRISAPCKALEITAPTGFEITTGVYVVSRRGGTESGLEQYPFSGFRVLNGNKLIYGRLAGDNRNTSHVVSLRLKNASDAISFTATPTGSVTFTVE